ncbi:MAG: MAC/perforin domain-containing protein [Bacilli bacterium]
MKMKICGLVILTGSLLYFANPISYNESPRITKNDYVFNRETTIGNNSYDTSGIGMGIDLVQADLGNTNYTKTTFVVEADYLQNTLLPSVNSYIDTATSGNNTEGSRYITTTKVSEFKTKLEASYSRTASVGGISIKCIDIGAKNAIETSNTSDIYKYRSQYYFNQKDVKNLYTFSVNKLTSSNTLNNHLDEDYIIDLSRALEKNTFDGYLSLFSNYGTHLVKTASYGAFRDVYYILKSEKYDFSTINDATLKSSISASVSGSKVEGTSDVKANIANETSLSTEFISSEYYCVAGSTNVITSRNENEYVDNINNLFNGVTFTNCVMTDIKEVIPLWEMLPSSLNTEINVNRIKNAFIKYFEQYNICIDDFGLIDYASLGMNFEKNYYSEMRGNSNDIEFTIRDSGAKYQDSDKFVLNTDFYNISTLYSKGYTKAEITLSLEIKEVDHGYQEFYAYARPNETSLLWSKTDYEYGGSDKITTYGRREFYIGEIPLQLLTSNTIYIEYGAHGSCEDDWKNRKPLLKVKFIKTVLPNC